ncbi:putative glycoside hydrolase [Oscillibacter sp. MSJ-2]|uniref:Glycoside hydrolase n=1 Tax=Dysosmobacter acutus TaxID=2841504 RepID=A0ABS6F6L6_9FIRM|nr:putative glycoside hydrolase [Dysosmobacter acutus]MBU5625937.1 putative glycoside hydrolase [Dysosmobacter acutus]
MAGPKGYSSYRGRVPRWKIALGILLTLILLAACTFLFLQKYIVYDDSGAMRLELPWMKPAGSSVLPPDGDEDLQIIISEPESKDVEELHILQLSDGILEGDWTQAVSALSAGGRNAFAVTMKATGGQLLYDSKVEAAVSSGAVKGNEQAMTALEGLLGGKEFYGIARLSCFHDSLYANANMDGAGLKNTGGYIFYDGNNTQWLDPGKEGARTYLYEIARECAALGFDEILLTDFSYPTEGKLNKIEYGPAEQSVNLRFFLQGMADALKEYDVKLSVELSAQTVSTGSDQASGQTLSDAAAIVDRIYVAAPAEEAAALRERVAAVSDEVTLVMEGTALESGDYLELP